MCDWDNKIKEDEMGDACRRRRRENKGIDIFREENAL
jgi:hypothetical protein